MQVHVPGRLKKGNKVAEVCYRVLIHCMRYKGEVKGV